MKNVPKVLFCIFLLTSFECVTNFDKRVGKGIGEIAGKVFSDTRQFDIFTVAGSSKDFDEVVTHILKSVTATKGKVVKTNSDDLKRLRLNNAAVFLLGSFADLQQFIEGHETDFVNRTSHRFVVYCRKLQIDQLKSIGENQSLHKLSFVLVNQSGDLQLIAIRFYSNPKTCKSELVKLNTFVNGSWKKKTFFDADIESFYGCRLRIERQRVLKGLNYTSKSLEVLSQRLNFTPVITDIKYLIFKIGQGTRNESFSFLFSDLAALTLSSKEFLKFGY